MTSELGLLDSFNVLKDFPIVKTTIIEKKIDLMNINYPCYIKVDSYIHKKQNGGVFFCDDKSSGENAFDKIKTNFPENKIVYQEVVNGLQIIIGIKKDNVFNKVIMFGEGGSNLDEKNIVFRTINMNRTEISKMFKDLKIGREISLYRHKEKLISLVEMVSYFARYNNIEEMDLNPVILSDKGPLIVDARIKNG